MIPVVFHSLLKENPNVTDKGFMNKKGFSLLEVLITVGLISIISGIAVPNYLKYTRNAKTAEAQSSLSQIYMAEKAFYLQWRFYTCDLLRAGVAPDGRLLYNAGFNRTDDPSYSDPVKSTYNERGGDIKCGDHLNYYKLCGGEFGNGEIKSCAFQIKGKGNKAGEPFEPPEIKGAAYKAEQDKFTAVAVANLFCRKPEKTCKPDKKRDKWSIDNYKQIKRLEDGT